ncbi:hypothetical protein [Novosphingobium rosa]|uniref:hypothetical protein n=1 Tax=Novosphingobium rosa TaxID=76978 RepID=UPI00082C44ED|nr:hypothetical protein [Novosphingobium rosa]
MNWAESIVVIVVVVAVARVVQASFLTRGGRHSVTFDHEGNPRSITPVAPQADPALRREVEELRERVRVLERIITDERKSRDLSDEIERLR